MSTSHVRESTSRLRPRMTAGCERSLTRGTAAQRAAETVERLAVVSNGQVSACRRQAGSACIVVKNG